MVIDGTSPLAQAPSATTEDCILALAQDLKARELVAIDVRGRCSYADTVVLCSGTSDRHVAAIAEAIDSGLHRRGSRVLGREGLREGQWALIDAGAVMVHVFHPFTREVYALEQLWAGCPSVRLTDGDGEPTGGGAAG